MPEIGHTTMLARIGRITADKLSRIPFVSNRSSCEKMTVVANGYAQGCLPDDLKKVLKSVAADLGDSIHDISTLQVEEIIIVSD